MTHDDAIRGEALSQITDLGERTRVRLIRATWDLQQTPVGYLARLEMFAAEIAQCRAFLKELHVEAPSQADILADRVSLAGPARKAS